MEKAENIMNTKESWRVRLKMQKDKAKSIAQRAGLGLIDQEAVKKVNNLIEILDGKRVYVYTNGSELNASALLTRVGERPYWERRVREARKYVFDSMEQLGRSSVNTLENITKSEIYDEMSNILGLGNEKVKSERIRTNKGLFEEYRIRINEKYLSGAMGEIAVGLRDKLEKITDILSGKARNENGKRIWKWSQRIKESQALMQEIKEESLRGYNEGKMDEKQLRSIYFDSVEAMSIGIEDSPWIRNKYTSRIGEINVYEVMRKTRQKWIAQEEQKVIGFNEIKQIPAGDGEDKTGSYIDSLRVGLNIAAKSIAGPILTGMRYISQIKLF